jgi:hypothetical protein
MMDSIHKLVSPSTYDCDLCAITYGAVSMNKEWRAYLKALPFDVHFFHKPDFLIAHPDQSETQLPLIGVETASGVEILLSAAAIKRCATVDALTVALNKNLSDRGFITAK